MNIIQGKIGGAQKVVIYGPEGIGKSTFAAAFPHPLFIDTEGSTKEMDVRRTDRPSSWTHLIQMVEYVKTHPDVCKTLVIDTADWAEQLCSSEICDTAQKKGIEDFGYGKGYIYLAEEFGKLLNALSDITELNINVVVTAHAQMRKFEQPDEMGSYDRWELKLQKKTAPLLKEWADMLLFANYKTYVVNVDSQGTEKGKNKVQGGRRVIYTTHHPCWDAKNRHNLPDVIELDFAGIARFIPSSGKVAAPMPDPMDHLAEKAAAQGVDVIVDGEPFSKEETPKQLKLDENPIPSDIPKPLADLMRANKVTVDEIQSAVGRKQYYPYDTPIKNYDPQFINGVLVGAWDQVFAMIKEAREFDLPFK